MSNNIEQIRIPVIFDKISVTLPVPEKHRLGIKDELINLMNDQNSIGYVVKWYQHVERYGDVFQFKIPTDTDAGHFTAKILIYPVCKAHNFFKVEFNPAKLGREGGTKLRRLLIKVMGPDTVRRLYYEGRITRLDITIDLHTSINCFIYRPHVRCSSIVRHESGEIGSQIVGSPGSNIHLTLYNKALEQGTNGDWWRLEIVLRDLGYSMADICPKLGDHFKELRFYRNFLSDTHFGPGFRKNVRAKGLNAALYALGRNERVRCLRKLVPYECWPFDPHRLTTKPGVGALRFLKSSKYGAHPAA